MSSLCAVKVRERYELIYREMRECAKHDSVWIASYGASHTSGYVEATLLECLKRSLKMRILISPTSMTEDRLPVPEIETRYIDDCHLKCWIFRRRKGNSTAIVGGRNLNSSTWSDFSALLDNQQQVKSLITHYKDLWSRSRKDMNTGLLHELFDKQE